MDRYKETFSKLKSNNEKALVIFTVLGDPDFKTSIDIIKSIIKGGADILELGFPFSDPIADGAVIQAADVRSLNSGINSDKCLEMIKDIRRFSDVPIGLLIYYNLVYQRGIENFYRDAKQAGVDSVLIADMPVEESENCVKAAKKHGINQVFIVSPLTNEDRLEKISENASGFLYLVSRLGVTGSRDDIQKGTLDLIKRVRPKTSLPLCVGFGISKPEHVKKVCNAGADGAIVGSSVIKIIEDNLSDKKKMLKKIEDYVKEMKVGTRTKEISKLFGSLKTKKSTKELMKEIREGYDN